MFLLILLMSYLFLGRRACFITVQVEELGIMAPDDDDSPAKNGEHPYWRFSLSWTLNQKLFAAI